MNDTMDDMRTVLLSGQEVVFSAESWSGLLVDAIADLTGLGEDREFTFRFNRDDKRVAIGLKAVALSS